MPDDRGNLCVRAFEALHPADGLRFEIRSEIPLARGLGSSAAAIVAGLMAADHMFELGLEREQIYARAVELEGHPDNVGAALYGGFVALPAGRWGPEAPPGPARPPGGRRGRGGDPGEEVPTEQARAAMPAEVPVADAVANVAAASQLVLGIERSDLALISRGLADRLHQPHRAHLYPRSMELLAEAQDAGSDRGDDLGRRAGAALLVLLAGHRQGHGGPARARRRLGRDPAQPRSPRWAPTCRSCRRGSYSSSPTWRRIETESE